MAKYRLHDIAERLGLTLIGDGDVDITGIASIESAQAGEICF